MKRIDATRKIEDLVRRVIEGGNFYLDAVDEISLFGSYVAGSEAPNDVDVLIRHSDPTGEIHAEQARRFFAHRSHTTPFEQALRGRQRGVSILFNQHDELERQGGFDLKVIWRRGESLDTVRHRIDAIQIDPAAGSAPRDYSLPALAGFESRTVLADRQRLAELTADRRITVRRFKLDRSLIPRGDGKRRRIVTGYSGTSPRRTAMNAVVAHLEQQGVPVTYSHRSMVIVRDYDPPRYATVEHGSLRLGATIDSALWRTRRSYCVLNLTGRGPFAVIETKRCGRA